MTRWWISTPGLKQMRHCSRHHSYSIWSFCSTVRIECRIHTQFVDARKINHHSKTYLPTLRLHWNREPFSQTLFVTPKGELQPEMCKTGATHESSWASSRRHLPNKNRCDNQVSSWRHISCHTDKNRYYTWSYPQGREGMTTKADFMSQKQLKIWAGTASNIVHFF